MAALGFDQEYASEFAYSVLKIYPIQLIGQGLSVQGLFMGPLYFYYLVPFFALSNLHPIGGAIGSVVLGIFSIIIFYIITTEIFGEKAGLLIAFLRAMLMTYITTDWSWVPTYSSGTVTLITWFCFYKIWHGNTKFLPLLGLTFGFFTSMHPILFPFYIVFLTMLIFRIRWLIKNKKLPGLKNILISFLAFIIPVSPLILFEYFHNFLEVKLLFSPHVSNGTAKTAGTFYHYLTSVFFEPWRILSLNSFLLPFIFFSFLIILLFLFFKKTGFMKDKFHQILLTLTFAVFLIYYNFAPIQVPEYYFQPLFDLTIVYFSATLILLLNKKRLVPIFYMVIILISVNQLILLKKAWGNTDHLTNVSQKDTIVKEILKRQPKNQEFYVSYITNLGWKTGYDYLFKIYGRQPQTREAKDPIYTIVAPISLSPASINFRSGDIGLILPK